LSFNRRACKGWFAANPVREDSAPTPPSRGNMDASATVRSVDTGAARSLIWRSAAKDMGLKIQSEGGGFYGVGGADTGGIVWVHDLTLAGSAIHRLALYATGRGTLTGNSVGLLGEDFLEKFDVEFDLAGRRIRLFTPRQCSGDQVVYWASAYYMTALARPNSSWLEAEVELDGHRILAMFDSGAGYSAITTQGLRAARITPESSAPGDPGVGLAGKPVDSDVAVFNTLTVGQEVIRNATLRVADLFANDKVTQTGSLAPQRVFEPDMLIGADFFLAHRIYVARSQNRLYFTYNGGPVFRHPSGQQAAPSTGDQGTDTR